MRNALDAASLSHYNRIRELLIRFDFDVNKLVSQRYDGASFMSGRHNGVQAQVSSFARYAVYNYSLQCSQPKPCISRFC